MNRIAIHLPFGRLFWSTLAVAAVCGLGTMPSYADTYRWVDANGVVNYSERKPRGVDASRLTVIKSRANSRRNDVNDADGAEATPQATPAAPTSAGPELNEQQQQMLADLQAKEAERLAAVEDIKSQNCERARRVLANLSTNGRLKVRGPNGEQRVLPEEERQAGIARAQAGIAANCSS